MWPSVLGGGTLVIGMVRMHAGRLAVEAHSEGGKASVVLCAQGMKLGAGPLVAPIHAPYSWGNSTPLPQDLLLLEASAPAAARGGWAQRLTSLLRAPLVPTALTGRRCIKPVFCQSIDFCQRSAESWPCKGKAVIVSTK